MGRKRQPPTDKEKDVIGRSCANCGADNDLNYHHIIPLSLGGNDVVSNMVCLCGRCHDLLHYGRKGEISHSSLVRSGIAAAKAKGVKVGKKEADYEKVMRLIAENSTQFNFLSLTTEHEIMQMAGVKEVCYSKCKRMLFEAMKADKWPYTWKKPKQCRNRPLYDRFIRRERGERI